MIFNSIENVLCSMISAKHDKNSPIAVIDNKYINNYLSNLKTNPKEFLQPQRRFREIEIPCITKLEQKIIMESNYIPLKPFKDKYSSLKALHTI